MKNFQFSVFQSRGRRASFQLRQRWGFTLIELLVVVAIIGVLTAIGLVSYQSTNKKARDGRRQSELEQIRTSLEIYRSDNNLYPDTLGELTPDYISAVPEDPKDFAYYYLPSGDNLSYELCAHLELEDDVDSYCGLANNCAGTCNYQVTNP